MSNCLYCYHFDNEKFSKDSRTKNAGICQKFCEVVFYNDKSCNQFSTKEKQVQIEFVQIAKTTKPQNNNHKPITNQISLF